MDTALQNGGNERKSSLKNRPKGPINKIQLITFTDYHDDSYSFYHFILFLYVLTVLLLYTTYGCVETFPYRRAFAISSIVVTSLPVLLTFKKVATARRDHSMKCGVALLFLLLATAGAYGIFVYSDHCAAELIRYNTTVGELTNSQSNTDHYNLFTLRDGVVMVDRMFVGQVVLKGQEVDCAAAPLASSAAAFDPAVPVGVWVADFAPDLSVLANWSQPVRQIVRADDNLLRAARTVIEAEAAKNNLTSTKEPQIFQWTPFDTTLKFDRKNFVIAASVIYGLLGLNTLIPPIYFYFQHTRTATLEITEETYLLSHYT